MSGGARRDQPGAYKEEALRNVKEALELVLEVLRDEAEKGEIAPVTVDA